MKDHVVIKSFPKGIALHLDGEVPFSELLREIGEKFAESRKFFGKTTLALAIVGLKLNVDQELSVMEQIRNNSDITICCLVDKSEPENNSYVRAVEQIRKRLIGGDDGQFFRGSLTDGDVLETDTSIIIIGDVNPGCTVVSTRNIIVLGSLQGEAYAGGNGRPGAYVAALEMEPERIKIGDFKYKTNEKKTKWKLGGKKMKPQIAFVKDDQIILEDFTKEMLQKF